VGVQQFTATMIIIIIIITSTLTITPACDEENL